MKNIFLGSLIIGIFALFGAPSYASGKQDLEVLAKAISFIQGGPLGTLDMAILYDPANGVSARHADEVVDILSNVVKGGKVSLTGKKIPVSSLSGASNKLIFVTKGMSAHYSKILAKAKANGGITVSTDEACLLDAGCVIVVKTEPSVDILVSSKAAGETGTEFVSVFSMMITKK